MEDVCLCVWLREIERGGGREGDSGMREKQTAGGRERKIKGRERESEGDGGRQK